MAKWFAPPDGGYVPKDTPGNRGYPPQSPGGVVREKPRIVKTFVVTETGGSVFWTNHGVLYGWSDGIVTWKEDRD